MLYTGIDPRFTWNNPQKYTLEVTRDLKLVAPYDLKVYQLRACSRLPEFIDMLTQHVVAERDVVDFKQRFASASTVHTLLLARCAELGIDGWLHPIEVGCFDMEICVFDPATKLVTVPDISRIQSPHHIIAQPGTCASLLLSACQDTHHRDRMRMFHKQHVAYRRLENHVDWHPFQHMYM